jgi:Zn-dependent alcohol dehydrogenase
VIESAFTSSIPPSISADRPVLPATGVKSVLESSYFSVATKGSFVQIGGPPDPSYRFSMDLVQHLFRGVKLFGCVEGDSVPEKFIPEMIGYFREGKLPGDFVPL